MILITLGTIQAFYDRSEAERVLFTNILEDLVGEPPDHDAFQTLISQELLELNGLKFNRI